MKKTKVIIPALGLLVLSTAASVTGTVAWFSANNTVSASGMSIKAVNNSANLYIANGIVSELASVNSTAPVTLSGYGVSATTVQPVDFNKADGTLSARIPAAYGTQPDVNVAGSASDWTNIGTLTTGAAASMTGDYVATNYFAYGFVTIARKQETAASFDLKASAKVSFGSASDLNQAFRVGIMVDNGTWYESSDSGVATATNNVAFTLNADGPIASGLADNAVHVALLVAWFEGEDANCTSNNALSLSTNSITWEFTSSNHTGA